MDEIDNLTKFVCSSCNKSFNTNSHLKQHMNKKNPCFNDTCEPNGNSALEPDMSLQNIINSYSAMTNKLNKNMAIIYDLKKQNKQTNTENKHLKQKLMYIKQIINQTMPNDTINNVNKNASQKNINEMDDISPMTDDAIVWDDNVDNSTIVDENSTIVDENNTIVDENSTIVDENSTIVDDISISTDELQYITGTNIHKDDLIFLPKKIIKIIK